MRLERKLFFGSGIFLRGDTIDLEAVRKLSMLKKDLELWLIVDSSRELFGKAPSSESLSKHFHRTVYLKDHGYSFEASGVFDFLVSESKIPREQCLFLDHNLKRAVLALNLRLPAAVIIDSSRLEREFLLRQLSEQSYVMHKRPTY